MKSARRNGGYTIIEVMIVLTVSAALFGSVIFAITQQNRRNQFTESVLTFEQRLGDIVNDVETGYYPAATNDNQGEMAGTIFIGKALQPNSALPASQLDVYTLSGRQQNSGKEVENLDQAEPKALMGAGNIVGAVNLTAGVRIDRILSVSGNPNGNLTGFAVVSGFGKNVAGGGLASGYNTRASMATLNSAVSATNPSFLTDQGVTNANRGILICLSEGNGGRQATITIGEDSQKLATRTTIDSNDTRCN